MKRSLRKMVACCFALACMGTAAQAQNVTSFTDRDTADDDWVLGINAGLTDESRVTKERFLQRTESQAGNGFVFLEPLKRVSGDWVSAGAGDTPEGFCSLVGDPGFRVTSLAGHVVKGNMGSYTLGQVVYWDRVSGVLTTTPNDDTLSFYRILEAGNPGYALYLGPGHDLGLVKTDLGTHEGRVDNPHTVTKAQVGLGSADNTADTAKPVSTAQQAELDLRTYRAATVASLASLSIQDNQLVQTTGYSAEEDGGGNLYRYDSGSAATIDGGWVIDGPGSVGRYLAQDQNIARPRQFGAAGDGVQDDRAAIQAAIDAAGIGGMIEFAPGTYRVTLNGSNNAIEMRVANQQLSIPRGVTIILGNAEIPTTGVNGDVIELDPNADGARIFGGGIIDGNHANNDAGVGQFNKNLIHIDGVDGRTVEGLTLQNHDGTAITASNVSGTNQDIVLQNMLIQNVGEGFLCKATDNLRVQNNTFITMLAEDAIEPADETTNFIISGNVIRTDRQTAIDIFDNCYRGLVSNNVIEQSGVTNVGAAIAIGGEATGRQTRNVDVVDNFIKGFEGIWVRDNTDGIGSNNQDINIRGNHIIDSANQGVIVSVVENVNCNVIGNFISGAGDDGIKHGGADSQITGNYVLNCNQDGVNDQGGIHLTGGSDLFCSGNFVLDNQGGGATMQKGIRLETVTNSYVINNVIDGSTEDDVLNNAGAWTTVTMNFRNNSLGGIDMGDISGDHIRVGQNGASGESNSFIIDNGAIEWRLEQDTANLFRLRDESNGHEIIKVSPGAGDNALTINGSGNIGVGHAAPDYQLDVDGGLAFRAVTAPSNPGDNGNAVFWLSDGGGAGDDGDVMAVVRTVAGATTTKQVAVYLDGSATYDPPALADGSGTSTTVTVTGAALGDFSISSFELDLAGVQVASYVSAPNTVTVRFQNESGGVVNLASSTLRAMTISK